MVITNTSYQLVDTQNDFDGLLRRIEQTKELAVDLEADSLFHFQEKVCLIQIGTRSECYILDPLKIDDISGLGAVLADPRIQKIFHGADYDIRSLYRDFRMTVNNLFDTELACRLLGLQSSGLNAILKNKANISLDKRFQKKDWSQRPLPEEMVSYAAQDVLYLIPLAEDLQKELALKGRLAWIEEECALLSQVRPHLAPTEPLFLKFKGAGRLSKQSLGVLEALLQLRTKIAMKKDKPLFKIIGNTPMMKMAVNRPTDMDQLNALNILSTRQMSMYGHKIINTIKAVLMLNRNQLPQYPRTRLKKSKPGQPSIVKELKKWRDAKAEILSIDPALIMNKALMSALAGAYPLDDKRLDTIEGIKKWQIKAFGKEIMTIVNME